MGSVRLMIGLDCDRPRGSFIKTETGLQMANRKMKCLDRINKTLNQLEIPRTYFICGQFLESMVDVFGLSQIRAAFSVGSKLSEIADHTYSHNIFTMIPSRPDKQPISSEKVVEEYRRNTQLFNSILGIDITQRGLRAPLGYYLGLKNEPKLVEALWMEGVTYISSDLRNEKHSIYAGIYDENNNLRQPFLYPCGLPEIPGHGWHDTAFSQTSKTPISDPCPQNIIEIQGYYKNMISQSSEIARRLDRDVFLGLIMHPYDISLYDPELHLFTHIEQLLKEYDSFFCTYNDARKNLIY